MNAKTFTAVALTAFAVACSKKEAPETVAPAVAAPVVEKAVNNDSIAKVMAAEYIKKYNDSIDNDMALRAAFRDSIDVANYQEMVNDSIAAATARNDSIAAVDTIRAPAATKVINDTLPKQR